MFEDPVFEDCFEPGRETTIPVPQYGPPSLALASASVEEGVRAASVLLAAAPLALVPVPAGVDVIRVIALGSAEPDFREP